MIESPEIKPKKKASPLLTAKLSKSKNFYKEDRCLDDYIDRTKLLKAGEKRMIKKLLHLRSREDGNEVKTTVSGLSKLLGIDIKTARANLIGLCDKNFIYRQIDEWKAGQRFPKRVYLFAETFPGFDLKTVFIRRGDKRRYNQRMAELKAKKPKISTSAAANSTCPNVPSLLDCCVPQHNNLIGSCVSDTTSTLSPSGERDRSVQTSLALPNLSGQFLNQNQNQKPKRSSKKEINFAHPGLYECFASFLQTPKEKRQLIFIARYMREVIRDLQFNEDDSQSIKIADWMFQQYPAFLGRTHKRNRVHTLMDFINDCLLTYFPDNWLSQKQLMEREMVAELATSTSELVKSLQSPSQASVSHNLEEDFKETIGTLSDFQPPKAARVPTTMEEEFALLAYSDSKEGIEGLRYDKYISSLNVSRPTNEQRKQALRFATEPERVSLRPTAQEFNLLRGPNQPAHWPKPEDSVSAESICNYLRRSVKSKQTKILITLHDCPTI